MQKGESVLWILTCVCWVLLIIILGLRLFSNPARKTLDLSNFKGGAETADVIMNICPEACKCDCKK